MREGGQALVEYALIILLVAIVCAFVLLLMGANIAFTLDVASDALKGGG